MLISAATGYIMMAKLLTLLMWVFFFKLKMHLAFLFSFPDKTWTGLFFKTCRSNVAKLS